LTEGHRHWLAVGTRADAAEARLSSEGHGYIPATSPGAQRPRHAALTGKRRHRAESASAPDRIRTCDLRFRRLSVNKCNRGQIKTSCSLTENRGVASSILALAINPCKWTGFWPQARANATFFGIVVFPVRATEGYGEARGAQSSRFGGAVLLSTIKELPPLSAGFRATEERPDRGLPRPHMGATGAARRHPWSFS
jgi:hypothetical protein